MLNATTAVTAKRLALLREAVPSAALFAVLTNPATPESRNQIEEIEEAARTLGQPIVLVQATTPRDFDQAFANLLEKRAGALFATADPMFTSAGEHLAALTSKHGVPSSYAFRDLVVSGGLMSYGPNLADAGISAARQTFLPVRKMSSAAD